MKKSIKVIPKKKRGRPATGRDPVSALRLPEEMTAAIDRWAERNGALSRSEAIRRLVEFILKIKRSARPIGEKAASKAAELAGKAIDRLGDPSVTDDERASRKRRLLKGPKEFR